MSSSRLGLLIVGWSKAVIALTRTTLQHCGGAVHTHIAVVHNELSAPPGIGIPTIVNGVGLNPAPQQANALNNSER